MRFSAASLPLLIALAACTETVPPVYEEPVPYSLPTAKGSLGPRLTSGPAEGYVVLSWMERMEEGAALRFSFLGENAWTEPRTLVEDPRMFVNWADFPSVRFYDDVRFAHWLSYSADETYSYDVRMVRSLDDGITWQEIGSPHDDGTPTEHGFVSQYPANSGVGLVWLDGRKTINDQGDDPNVYGMTLRSAVVGPDGSRSNEQELDGLICDCCQTDVAVSSKGPIAVYRDRTEDEIRDISITRFRDGRWQTGQPFSRDGWEIHGCPVNGPAISAAGDNVAVAWFTAANDIPKVQLRTSTDGGDSFGEPIDVVLRNSSGHVDVAWIGDNSYAVSYVRKRDGQNHVLVRSVTVDGKLGAIKTVARTQAARVVPQMVFRDGELIFAWTDENNGVPRVYASRVGIAYAD